MTRDPIVLVFWAFFSGCLPERNNEHDPTNAPRPSLVVYDRNLPRLTDGSCPPYAPEEREGWGLALAAPRGACLVLDAGESTDPRGDDADLAYSFLVIDSRGEPVAGEDIPEIPPVVGPPALAILHPADLRSLQKKFPAKVTLAVDVTGERGSRRAAVDLQILNTRPIAIPGKGVSLPYHGFPWAPGEDMSTELSGAASFDPDGDPPAFCWSANPNFLDWQSEEDGGSSCGVLLPGQAATRCTGTSSAECTIDLPSGTSRRFVVWLQVGDGDDVSDPVPLEATVRVPGRWVVTPDGSLALLDPLSIRLGLSEPTDYVSLEIDGVPPRVASWLGSNFIVSPLEGGSQIAAVDTGPGSSGAAFEVDPTRGRVWVVLDSFVETRVVSIRSEDDPEAYSEEVDAEFADGPLDLFGPEPFVAAVDALGALWFSARFGSLLRVVDESLSGADPEGTTLATAAAQPGLSFIGMAARPQTGEVWSVQSRGTADPDPPAALLVRHRRQGAQVFSSCWRLGGLDAVGPEWNDRTTLWVASASKGLVYIDAGLLPSAIEVAGPGACQPVDLDPGNPSVVAVFPEVSNATRLFSDRATRRCLVLTEGSGLLYEATPNPLGLRALQAGFDVDGIDGVGALIGSVQQGIGYRRALSGDGVISRAAAPTQADPVAIAAGTLWVARADPPGILGLSESGSLVDEITSLELSGGRIAPVPTAVVLAMDPRGRYAWIAGDDVAFGTQVTGFGGVFPRHFLVDLAAPRLVPGRAAAIELPAAVLGFAAASSVYQTTSAARRLWIGDTTAGSAYPSFISTLDSSGNLSAIPSFPPGSEEIRGFSVFEAEDAACAVTQDLASPDRTMRLYRLDPFDASFLTAVGSTSLGSAFSVTGVAAANDPPSCWVAFADVDAALGAPDGSLDGSLLRRYEGAVETATWPPSGVSPWELPEWAGQIGAHGDHVWVRLDEGGLQQAVDVGRLDWRGGDPVLTRYGIPAPLLVGP